MITFDISQKICKLAQKYNVSALKVGQDYCNREEKHFHNLVEQYRLKGVDYKNAFDKVQSTLPSYIFQVLDRYYSIKYR